MATVNGQPILITDYLRQFNQMVKQYQEMSKAELTEDMIKAMRLKEMARDRLIDEAVLLQAAKRLGFTVSDADLRAEIQKYPAFQRDGKFDEQLYFMVLARNHLNSAEFEEQERRRLEMKKLIDEIYSLGKVSDAELQEMYNIGKEAVKVSYLAVTPDKFLAKQPAAEADVSHYYQDHQEQFRQPARARVNYFLFRFQDFQERVKPSAAEIEAFIKEHPAEYTRPKVIRVRQIMLALPAKAEAKEREDLEKQAQELLKKLQGGEDFAQTAKARSQDPASKDKGGDLGYVPRGQHPPEWDQVAFGLKPGQVGLAKTPQAIYLLKVEEVKETEPIPDAEARVTQRLKSEKAKVLAQEAAKEARTALLQGAAATAEVAKRFGIALKESPLIGGKDQLPGVTAPAFYMTAVDLKPGEVSRVVNLPDGFAVMKSLEYQEAHLPPLAQVKDQVVQAVKQQGAKKEAEQEAARLLARLQKGETLAQVAAAAGLPVKESRFLHPGRGLRGPAPGRAPDHCRLSPVEGAPLCRPSHLLAGQLLPPGLQGTPGRGPGGIPEKSGTDDEPIPGAKEATPVPILAGQRAPPGQD